MELRRLHKRFGHPHSDKLYNLLKRSGYADIDESTRKTLEQIMWPCKLCQTYAQAPRRFKFTLRDEKCFNSSVYVDIFYVMGKPVLHARRRGDTLSGRTLDADCFSRGRMDSDAHVLDRHIFGTS